MDGEIVSDILTTAFESGVSWINRVTVDTWPPGAEYASDVPFYGGSIKIETDDGTFTVDRSLVEKGIRRTLRYHQPKMTLQDWYEQHDVTDASDALQYALFGEVIYG